MTRRLVLGCLGDRRVRMWASTSDQDELAPVGQPRSLGAELTALPYDVTLRTYPGGHTLRVDEKASLIDWWLDR